MKKLLVCCCLSALILGGSLVSCQKDRETASIAKLEKASEMAKMYGGSYSAGKIDILSNGSNVVIAQNQGGRRTVFTLQREKQGMIPTSGEYEVLYMRHLLILNSMSNGVKYVLFVNNDDSQEMLKKLPSSYFNKSQVLDGFGLSMTPNGGAQPAICANAGGSGSSSCSNSCCSVSCNTGYYAACGNSCNCRKNGT